MNVLFLTLSGFNSLQDRNIYTDLLREFTKNGHQIYTISPVEKREKTKTYIHKEENATILRLRIGNIQKTNIIEKGISTIMIEPLFISAIKRYFSDVRFDLVLYSTPPITFVSAIDYVKRRDNAHTYLLLKDIFPQNAVDIGMLSTSGIKGFLYKHFRNQEKRLYSISDTIGCMSPANVDYLVNNNRELVSHKVEVCPNCIDVLDKSINADLRDKIRAKYKIPLNKRVLVYGGNLGKPQGIPFLIECLRKCAGNEDVFFLIVGDGTEYKLLEGYANDSRQANLRIMKRLPKEDYDTLVGACDIGMIFLDHQFTIPNFPSRLLSYMQAKLPVLAVTDKNTDIGKIIVNGGFGWWCESNNSDCFRELVKVAVGENLDLMGENGFKILNEKYTVEQGYKTIVANL